MILSALETRRGAGLVQHTMQTNPPVEQNKTLNGPKDRRISPAGKAKVYGGNDLPKSSLKFTMKD